MSEGLFATLGHSLRLVRAAAVLAREGAFADVDRSDAPAPVRMALRFADFLTRSNSATGGLAAAMIRLGPSYVKLGQFMATRPDVVGAKAASALEQLQDRVPPESQERAAALVAASFGGALSVYFDEFGESVAAASIAQVHRARAGGKELAVKILRPGLRRRFARDLGDMRFAARFLERRFSDLARLKLPGVVETLARSVRMELDFRIEAAAASEFRENIAGDEDFRAPAVDWDRTTRDVLTTEWVEATPLSDVERIDALGFDRPALARTLIRGFLRHALRDGFFHADMHPGNLLVDSEKRIVAVDFGIMGRLGLQERRFLAEILYGFIRRDYRRVAEVHFEAGYVPGVHRVEDFAQAIRAVGEPIRARTADQISMAKLLTLLFEITELFDMSTRVELVLLQKTMVVVEGVARKLDPKLDMWATAEPVVGSWIAENLGPKGKIEDVGRIAERWLQALAAGPPVFAERMSGTGQIADRKYVSSDVAIWLILTCAAVLAMKYLLT